MRPLVQGSPETNDKMRTLYEIVASFFSHSFQANLVRKNPFTHLLIRFRRTLYEKIRLLRKEVVLDFAPSFVKNR